MALMLSKKKSITTELPSMPTQSEPGTLVSGQTSILTGKFTSVDTNITKIHYKSNGTSNNATIHVYFMKKDGTYSTETVTDLVSTTDFRSTSLTVPDDAFGVGVYYNNTISPSATYYFE